MFSATIFAISLFVYFGLAFGYRPYLESEVKRLSNQIQSFAQQVPLEEQKKIIAFYSQLANLRTLLENHVVISPLFPWLEESTQANIYFTKLNLTVQSEQAVMSGVARSVSDLAEQLAIFRERPEVKRVVFSNVAFTSGGTSAGSWQFSVALTFDQELFHGVPSPTQ